MSLRITMEETDVSADHEEIYRQRCLLLKDWYQSAFVEKRIVSVSGGLLRVAFPKDLSGTPPAFRELDVRLVLPEEETAQWEGMQEWALAVGLADRLAPREDDTQRAGLAVLTSPAPNAVLRGSVQLVGRAASDDFESFVLEWGRGQQPTSWVAIRDSRAPVQGGVVGAWNTVGLPNGEYTLRLRMRDAKLGELRYAIPVRIDNGETAPTDDLAPFAQILSPWNGAVLTGSTPISGLAGSGALQNWVVEVGAGAAPTEWERLANGTTPITNQTMTSWDTTALSDGLYTLRLTVRDALLGSAVSTILVTVQN